jgi:hypothetical protein
MIDPYTEKELFTWMMAKPDSKLVDKILELININAWHLK